jgi:hypothetical protein
MPRIQVPECRQCGLTLTAGLGRCLFVLDQAGKPQPVPHPLDRRVINDWIDGRNGLTLRTMGFRTQCVCLECFQCFDLDLGFRDIFWLRPVLLLARIFGLNSLWGRDRMRCPGCQGNRVVPVWKIIGGSCPRCRVGRIRNRDTGLMA